MTENRVALGAMSQQAYSTPAAGTLSPPRFTICGLPNTDGDIRCEPPAKNPSPATVRNQLHAIYRKLDVSNRTELAFVLASVQA